MDLICQIIPAAVLLMNIVAFAAYGIDKRRARKGRWRIPESTLLQHCTAAGGVIP